MQRIAYIVSFYMSLLVGFKAESNQEIRIIEARRNIPLTDSEPRFMDYYLNAGTVNGVKKDQVVNVLRKLPIRNAQGTEEFGTVQIPVGQIRVIFTDARTAIAREFKVFDRTELPIIENQAIMIGDVIDLSGSFDYKKRAAVEKK